MSQQPVEKKPQTRVYADGEMITIRNTFRNAENVIRAIRKTILQMPLEATDQSIIENLKLNTPALKVLRKALLPTLNPNAPAHQLIDLWMTVEIKDKNPDEAMPHLFARATLIDYLDQQLSILEGSKVKQILKLENMIPNFTKSADENYSNLVARNSAISHVEMQLNVLKVLAEQDDKTLDQLAEDYKKNSTK